MVCEFYGCSKNHFLLHVAFFPKTLNFSAYVGQSREVRTHLLSYWVTKIMLNFRIEESLKYIATHERWKTNIEWKERGRSSEYEFFYFKQIFDEIFWCMSQIWWLAFHFVYLVLFIRTRYHSSCIILQKVLLNQRIAYMWHKCHQNFENIFL